jgi:hypothetical protein
MHQSSYGYLLWPPRRRECGSPNSPTFCAFARLVFPPYAEKRKQRWELRRGVLFCHWYPVRRRTLSKHCRRLTGLPPSRRPVATSARCGAALWRPIDCWGALLLGYCLPSDGRAVVGSRRPGLHFQLLWLLGSGAPLRMRVRPTELRAAIAIFIIRANVAACLT